MFLYQEPAEPLCFGANPQSEETNHEELDDAAGTDCGPGDGRPGRPGGDVGGRRGSPVPGLLIGRSPEIAPRRESQLPLADLALAP